MKIVLKQHIMSIKSSYSNNGKLEVLIYSIQISLLFKKKLERRI